MAKKKKVAKKTIRKTGSKRKTAKKTPAKRPTKKTPQEEHDDLTKRVIDRGEIHPPMEPRQP
jgi:topoisomerase IA-like protein